MEWTLRNLNSANTNVSASRAGIRDADFAKETAAFTKQQILAKTGEAVLAQANALPKAALNLLA
jgi:flagellin